MISAAIHNDRIRIVAPYRHKDTIKQIPGRRWDKKNGVWTLPATAAAAAELHRLLPVEQTTPGFDDLLAEAEQRSEAAVHKTADTLPNVPNSKTSAWLHQRQAFWFAEPSTATMLAMDMGTGKSKIAVDLIANRNHKLTLILCPKSVVGVWPKQFEIHSGIVLMAEPLTKGTVAKRVAQAQETLERAEQLDLPCVIIINYEAAWRKDFAEWAIKQRWDMVVLDESHRIKAPGGKASRFCGRISKIAKHRLCLTGTPMPHSPLDIYGQYRFLDPGIFGTSFTNFRARYAVMGGYKDHEVKSYQNQEELAQKMYSIAFRVMASDVLDLPDDHHIERTTTLEPKARKVYDQLEKELWADIGDGTVTAANALVRLLRLQQVTSGLLPLDDLSGNLEVQLEEISTAKRELLADTLTDLRVDEPIVVFCRFTHDLNNVRSVCEAQGRVYGELSGSSRDGLTDEATMRPDIDVIGVQLQSGGVGIDLTRAAYAVYYSVGFSLGDFEQSLARLLRPGQDRPVTYLHLCVEGSVDQIVYEALSKRRIVVDHVLEMAP